MAGNEDEVSRPSSSDTPSQESAPGAPNNKPTEANQAVPPDLKKGAPTDVPSMAPKAKKEDSTKSKVEAPQMPNSPGKKKQPDQNFQDPYVRALMAIMYEGREIGENLKTIMQQKRFSKQQKQAAAKTEKADDLMKDVQQLSDKSTELDAQVSQLQAMNPQQNPQQYQTNLKATGTAIQQQQLLNQRAIQVVNSSSFLSKDQKGQALQSLNKNQGVLQNAQTNVANMQQSVNELNATTQAQNQTQAAVDAGVEQEHENNEVMSAIQEMAAENAAMEEAIAIEQQEEEHEAEIISETEEQEAEQAEAQMEAVTVAEEARVRQTENEPRTVRERQQREQAETSTASNTALEPASDTLAGSYDISPEALEQNASYSLTEKKSGSIASDSPEEKSEKSFTG